MRELGIDQDDGISSIQVFSQKAADLMLADNKCSLLLIVNDESAQRRVQLEEDEDTLSQAMKQLWSLEQDTPKGQSSQDAPEDEGSQDTVVN